MDRRTHRDSDRRPASQLARQPGGRSRPLDLCDGIATARDALVPARRRKPFDDEPEELQELSRLVFGEMLSQFPRLENIIDSRKVRAIELLRAIGFAVEPTLPEPSADSDLRLVWIDSDRLHCGGRASLLPN